MKAIYPALPFVLVLAACSRTPPPVPVPPTNVPYNPGVTPPVVPQGGYPKVDWRELSVMAGSWRWSREGTLSVARFALPNGTERISFACDPARRSVTLRYMQIASGEQPLTITTTDTKQIVTGQATTQAPYAIEVAFASRDQMLDAIAFSRGRFMIESGSEWAIAPSWPEVSRVIEDCR
jgi:hypothetical protein